MRCLLPVKKSRNLFVLLIVLGLSFPAVAASPAFRLKLGLGAGAFDLGDVSLAVRGGQQYALNWAAAGEAVPGDGIQEPGPMNNAGVELMAVLSPRLALGLEVALNGATRDGQVGWIGSVNGSVRHLAEMRYTVVPVRLNIHYFLGRPGGLRAYGLAGIGLYAGRLNLRQETLSRSTGADRLEYFSGRGQGTALGLHAGAGLQVPVTRRFAVFVEVLGRAARVGSLTGDVGLADTGTGDTDLIEGTFWLSKTGDEAGEYHRVLVSSAQPADPEFRDVRKFRLDLSGWAVRAGIVINL